MIDESQNIYYICYAILCGLLGIAYLRFQSTQSQHTLVTTKEFKQFQTTFLVGYSTITLCELIANGNYFNLYTAPCPGPCPTTPSATPCAPAASTWPWQHQEEAPDWSTPALRTLQRPPRAPSAAPTRSAASWCSTTGGTCATTSLAPMLLARLTFASAA